jgi:hypothetical protein
MTSGRGVYRFLMWTHRCYGWVQVGSDPSGDGVAQFAVRGVVAGLLIIGGSVSVGVGLGGSGASPSPGLSVVSASHIGGGSLLSGFERARLAACASFMAVAQASRASELDRRSRCAERLGLDLAQIQ